MSFFRRNNEVPSNRKHEVELHGQELMFSFFPSSVEAVAPLRVLRDPAELTKLTYKELAPRPMVPKIKYSYLEQPWKAEFTTQPAWYGGSQHHELLYRIAQGDIPNDSQDVLINIDGHHDTGYDLDGSLPTENEVNRGSFVAHGFMAEAWGSYIFVPAEGKSGTSSSLTNKDLPIMVAPPRDIFGALEHAVSQAKSDGGKVAVSIDFDFFVGTDPQIPFEPEKVFAELKTIVDFLRKNKEMIQYVYWCESPEFTKNELAQKMMYQMLARLI